MPETIASNLKGINRLIGRLRGLLAACAVLPMIVMALVAWESRRGVLEEAEQVVRRTAAILAEHTLKVLDTEELILDRIQERIAGMNWDEISRSREIATLLRTLGSERGQVASIWLIDSEGYV